MSRTRLPAPGPVAGAPIASSSKGTKRRVSPRFRAALARERITP